MTCYATNDTPVDYSDSKYHKKMKGSRTCLIGYLGFIYQQRIILVFSGRLSSTLNTFSRTYQCNCWIDIFQSPLTKHEHLIVQELRGLDWIMWLLQHIHLYNPFCYPTLMISSMWCWQRANGNKGLTNICSTGHCVVVQSHATNHCPTMLAVTLIQHQFLVNY